MLNMDSGLILFLWLVIMLLTAFVNIMFAVAVFHDSAKINEKQNKTTFLVGGFVWTAATLIGGVFVAGVYWLVHYSALNTEVYAELESADEANKNSENQINKTLNL